MCAAKMTVCNTSGTYQNSEWGNYFTNFIEDCTSDINEVLQSGKIMFYPNPTNDRLCIESKNFMPITIQFFNMLGKEVLIQNANGKIEININHLPKGIYNVNVLSDGKIIGNSKIVKQ